MCWAITDGSTYAEKAYFGGGSRKAPASREISGYLDVLLRKKMKRWLKKWILAGNQYSLIRLCDYITLEINIDEWISSVLIAVQMASTSSFQGWPEWEVTW